MVQKQSEYRLVLSAAYAFLCVLLTACTGGATKIESDLGIKGAPDWVNEGTQAVSNKDGRLIHRERRYGDIGRSEVRRLSVIEALNMLLELAA